MGLIKKNEFKKLELRLEVLEMLKEYGIEPNDLHIIHEALEFYKENKNKVFETQKNIPVIDDETKKKIKSQYENSSTPNDFIKQFAGESEEFYPYGKPKENN